MRPVNVIQEIQWPGFKIVDMHIHLPVKQDEWLAPWRERYIKQNGAERWEQLQALRSAPPSWLPEFCRLNLNRALYALNLPKADIRRVFWENILEMLGCKPCGL